MSKMTCKCPIVLVYLQKTTFLTTKINKQINKQFSALCFVNELID